MYLLSVGHSGFSLSHLNVPLVIEMEDSVSVCVPMTYSEIGSYLHYAHTDTPNAGRSNLATQFGSSSSSMRNLLKRLMDMLT